MDVSFYGGGKIEEHKIVKANAYFESRPNLQKELYREPDADDADYVP